MQNRVGERSAYLEYKAMQILEIFVIGFLTDVNFYIHGSLYRYCILIRSNKMQQYAGVFFLQNYSTYFGCPSHASSGVHETLIAASGTAHSIRGTTFLQRGLRPRWRKAVALIRDMTCTRGCSYSFMYS